MSTECNAAPLIQVSSVPDCVKSTLLAINAAALVDTLFYGIHFVLFCICMFILIRSKRPTQWFIIVSAFVMFALSTADISLTIRSMTHDITLILDPVFDGYASFMKFLHPTSLIFVTNNFIAELILLYRCYMIWGRSKYILVLTSFLVLGDTVWGYFCTDTVLLFPISKPLFPAYLWSVFAINIIISGITAGRIFWVSQIARPILGDSTLRHFRIIIAILLESSAVYSTFLLLWLICPSNSSYRLALAAMMIRVVTIMPTLLIVQVGLLVDRIARDPDPRNHEQPATSTVILDTIVAGGMHENQDTSSSGHVDLRYP